MRGPPLGSDLRRSKSRRGPLTLAAHSRSFVSAFFNSRTASEGRAYALPRAAGRGEHATVFSPRAIAPKSCQPPRARKRPREAKRRKAHAIHCPRFRKRVYAVCATRLLRGRAPSGARSPSGASPRLATPVATSIGSAPGRVSWDPAPAGVTRLRLSQSSALRTDRSVCRTNGVQGRPGASANPRAGTASRSAFQVLPRESDPRMSGISPPNANGDEKSMKK